MYKFIFILCVAVFASATHAASIEKPQTLQEVKDECIAVILSTFDRFSDTLRDIAEESETEAGRATYDDAVIFVGNLIEKFQAADSIDLTKKPHNILAKFPDKCGGDVADAVEEFIWDALVDSGSVILSK